MPYAFSKMSHNVKIATDRDETFALLVFNNKSNWEEMMISGEIYSCEEIMLVFTEEDGFVDVVDYKYSVEEQDRLFNRPLEFISPFS